MPHASMALRLPSELAERLREYAFTTRSNKTAVIIAALEEFLPAPTPATPEKGKGQ